MPTLADMNRMITSVQCSNFKKPFVNDIIRGWRQKPFTRGTADEFPFVWLCGLGFRAFGQVGVFVTHLLCRCRSPLVGRGWAFSPAPSLKND